MKVIEDNRENGKIPLEQMRLVERKLLREIDRICKKYSIPYWLDGGTLLGAVRHRGFIPWDDDIDVAMLRKDYERFLEIAQKELPNDIFLQNWNTEKEFYLPMTKLRDKYSSIVETENRNLENHSGIFIDIFPFDYLPQSNWLKNIQMVIFYILKCFKLEAKASQLKMKTVIGNRTLKIIILTTLQIIGKTIPKTLYKKLFNLTNKIFYKISPSKQIGDGLVNPTYYKKSIRNIEKIFPLTTVIFEGEEFPAPKDWDFYLTGLYKNYMELPSVEDRKIHSQEVYPFKKCNHKETLDWKKREE
ncbi:hypothetical protein IX293_002166 [Fusobacterium necrophorum]|nr:LicD family protein [Fusobacterium necrophorum]MBR8823891.1 hypothetical protein [Fusobacterium necrophorum]